MITDDGRAYVRRKLAEWQHPDIVDRYGRVWTWIDHDIYCHDETLAFPRDMIDDLGLPRPEVADNPNYAKLCVTCRSEWRA